MDVSLKTLGVTLTFMQKNIATVGQFPRTVPLKVLQYNRCWRTATIELDMGCEGPPNSRLLTEVAGVVSD
jgi:hypothetical protein